MSWGTYLMTSPRILIPAGSDAQMQLIHFYPCTIQSIFPSCTAWHSRCIESETYRDIRKELSGLLGLHSHTCITYNKMQMQYLDTTTEWMAIGNLSLRTCWKPCCLGSTSSVINVFCVCLGKFYNHHKISKKDFYQRQYTKYSVRET